MLEKPKRPTKPKIQDRLQPTTVEELIRKYDLENKGVYDFLDKMVDYINDNNKGSITKVGDIFLTTNEENPGIRFGGVWKQWMKMILILMKLVRLEVVSICRITIILLYINIIVKEAIPVRHIF